MVHSPTRTSFLAKKRQKRETRALDLERAERQFFCKALREVRGALEPCRWAVDFYPKTALAAKCGRCGAKHEREDASDKWLTAFQAQTKRSKDDELAELARAGEYGAPIPDHEGYCDFKAVDLMGLRKTQRKMLQGKGRIGRGTCFIDRMGRPVHWCREQKT